jgi:hypothetical protein
MFRKIPSVNWSDGPSASMLDTQMRLISMLTTSSHHLAFGLHSYIHPKQSSNLVHRPHRCQIPWVRDTSFRILLLRPQPSLSSRVPQRPHQPRPRMRNHLALLNSSRTCAGQTSVGLTIGERSSTTSHVKFSQLVIRSAKSVLK